MRLHRKYKEGCKICWLSWCFLCCSIVGFLGAQDLSDYYIRQYTTEDGLSDNWITELCLDERGYLWLGTQYGLNVFDGNSFQVFTYQGREATLPANWVFSLHSRSDTTLWLGTYGRGWANMLPDRSGFSHVKRQVAKTILDISEDGSRQRLYMASNQGTFYLQQGAQKYILDNNYTHQLELGADSKLYQASREGLFVYDPEKEEQTCLLPEVWVNSLWPISQDSLLLFVEDQLQLLIQQRSGNWQLLALGIQASIHLQNFYYPFIFRDRQGNFWVSGKGGLWFLDKRLKSRKFFSLADLLPPAKSGSPPVVTCMLEDRDGLIWMGTTEGLLQFLPQKPFRHPRLPANLPVIRGLAAVGDTFLFSAAQQTFYWHPGMKAAVDLLPSSLLSPFANSQGHFYGVLKKGESFTLVQLKPQDEKVKALNCKLPNKTKWKVICEDKKGRLWISDWNRLFCYDPISAHCFSPNFSPAQEANQPNMITDLLLDQQDRLWVGCVSNGLFRIDDISQVKEADKLHYEHYQNSIEQQSSISSSLIQSLHQDKQGRIWIGTDGGLNQYIEAEGNFRKWLRSDQMPDDKILGIQSDEDGNVWLATASHGILQFNPNEEKFINFRRRDGLYADNMLLGSSYKDHSGRIWMGSSEGLHAFYPKEVLPSISAPDSLIWQSLRIYREDSSSNWLFPKSGSVAAAPLLVKHQDHQLEFSFSWLDYQYAGEQQYYYWLEGLSSGWLPSQSEGLLSLSQLSAGSYTLWVKATSFRGGQQAFAAPIYLRVLPPWYRSTWAWLLYAILFSSFIFYLYKSQIRRRMALLKQEKSKELLASKMQFFRQIAHEFRSPLTILFGASEQMKQQLPPDAQKAIQPHLQQLDTQAAQLNQYVDQILELASIQENKQELQLQTSDFIAFQRYLFWSFSTLADAKGISLVFNAQPTRLFMAYDRDKWQKISNNLLSNALKFTASGGTIYLDIQVQKEGETALLICRIRDTGRGIPPRFLPHVFEPFAQEDNSQGGSGIGLAIVKAMIALHGGQITLESDLDKGTAFLITMPVRMAEVEENEVPISLAGDKPSVLVAEDNEEIREYLKNCLAEEYHVFLAADGQAAWEICQEELPDLLISDLLMPKLDGLKLLKNIRAHSTTNHLPTILLTGKNEQRDRLIGLEAGADDYLAKPFHPEELKLRIRRLLLVQQQLQQKYQSGDFSLAHQSKEKDIFVQQFVAIIEKELDNEELSVDEVALRLHMSRVHLFRKLKNITGQSPSLFIRQIRLQKAKEMLQLGELSVSEVAYATGFKDPAYFSRVYRERYGHAPSKMRW